MPSLYKKVISGKPYWYLREMAWVGGKPKLASERYLGTAAEIEALLESREAAMVPQRTRHLAYRSRSRGAARAREARRARASCRCGACGAGRTSQGGGQA